MDFLRPAEIHDFPTCSFLLTPFLLPLTPFPLLLNTHTYYSIHYGAMSPKELLEETRKHGHEVLALTDINNTSACIDTVRMAPEYGIKPVLGIDFRNGMQQQYVALAKNNEGFRELNEHLTRHLHSDKPFAARAPEFENAFVIYPLATAPSQLGENEFIGVGPKDLTKLRFGGLVTSSNSTGKERVSRSSRYDSIDISSTRTDTRFVILQPATFRNKRDFNAHRLLRAIELNTILSKLPLSEQTSPNELLLSREELYTSFKDFPQIIRNTEKLLDACTIDFEFGTNKNKSCFFDSKATDVQKLREECERGLLYRYGTRPQQVIDRMEKELKVISEFGYCSYFLINWDMVNYARHKNYYYVGRGSGANSMVAYLLRITDVDPIELDLYFERFINPHRRHPPDFDIDFSWADRDDVTKYLFEKHGYDRVALLGSYNTLKYNSVVRELGKVFGLPAGDIDQLQGANHPNQLDHVGALVLRYSKLIRNFPNYLSVHASGIIISEEPMSTYTATFLPPKGFPTTQFSMLEAEDVGLYKFDILSQRGLGKIKDGLEIIKHNAGTEIDIHDVQKFKQDEKVKDMLRHGKAVGCFYVESPAMRMLLTKLKADDYLGLVAASSIIRPGVAKSGMMREYILRFRDKERREKAQKELPELYKLLAETYGVMVYQEDVIRVAHLFAGLTLGEADILRRGMSWKFKERNEFSKVQGKFFDNCKRKGYDEKTISEIWHQIETFANFAFSKGHSASYAVESYQALYLKAYYPLEFMVATINNGGGFYRPELYFHEAKMHGAQVELPCVNNSESLTSIKGNKVYIGFHLVQSLEAITMNSIVGERNRSGSFKSLRDFMKRVPIELEQLRLLIRANAFRFTGVDKKKLLWDMHFVINGHRKTQPTRELFDITPKDLSLPELFYQRHEDAFDEMELLGFPLHSPFELLEKRPDIPLCAAELKQHIGEEVSIIGYLVHVKHTRTSKGDTMHFGVFLDLDGHWIDSVHFPPIAKKFPFQGPGCYVVTGKVVEEFEFVSIEASKLERLPYVSLEDNSVRLKPLDNYSNRKKPTGRATPTRA